MSGQRLITEANLQVCAQPLKYSCYFWLAMLSISLKPYGSKARRTLEKCMLRFGVIDNCFGIATHPYLKASTIAFHRFNHSISKLLFFSCSCCKIFCVSVVASCLWARSNEINLRAATRGGGAVCIVDLFSSASFRLMTLVRWQ